MALVVEQTDIQTWLEPTKTPVETMPTEQAQHVQDLAFGMLRTAFDNVDDWVDKAATPDLIVDAVAMWTAGLVFNKHYAQQSTSFSAYGNILIARAKDVLEGLMNGTIVITETLVEKDRALPAFWPTDQTFGPVFTMEGSL